MYIPSTTTYNKMLIVKEIPIKYFRPFLAHQFPHFVTCDLNYSVEIQNEMSNSFSTTYNQISIIYAISITYMYFGAFWASGTVPSAWYQIKDRSESNSFSFTSLNKLLTSQVAWLKKMPKHRLHFDTRFSTSYPRS